jgi:fructosamine-3-kinase
VQDRRVNPQASIAGALASLLGGGWSAQPLHASGFSATWRAQRCELALFVKSLPMASASILEAEADGLAALAATRTVRVPEVVACAADGEHDVAVLALEWLDLRSADARCAERLGNALAALHLAAAGDSGRRYGWHRDNMLGGTLQRNRWSEQGATAGWIDFYRRHRLGAMRERLAASGAASLVEAVDVVIDVLPAFFADGHVPRPSLIHGDLWQGNWGMLADGTPVIYDPAVSCSDAEAELAMMELFGGPPHGFWAAYRKQAGLHDGYARRRGLYQLYHLLNHALLFGGGYVRQSEQLARVLAGR